jgi:hypothetical protein
MKRPHNAHSDLNASPSVAGKRRKRGSVLLLVVLLLLLLAIMGTSYLATTRVDRLTSAGNVANAQLDQLVGTVSDLADSYIVNSLLAYNANGSYSYRPANNLGTYNNFDAPDYLGNGTGDPWLADRVPTLPNPAVAVNATSNPPIWAAITAPMNAAGSGNGYTAGTPVFESPVPPLTSGAINFTIASSGATGPLAANPAAYTGSGPPFTYTTYTNVVPSFQSVNGNNVPAFVFKTASSTATYVAGDADGDGIADCGLFRLPGVYADGLTYYAGVRIVDNNSAINVNTANDWGSDASPTAAVPYTNSTPPYVSGTTSIGYAFGFFPGNVGLNEMLGNAADRGQVTNYQLNSALPNGSMVEDDGATQISAGADWGSQADLLAGIVAHRLGNPGYFATSPTAAIRAQALPPSEQTHLAYRAGVFVDPRSFLGYNYSAGVTHYTGYSLLDGLMPSTVFAGAPNLNSSNTTSSSTTSYPLSGETAASPSTPATVDWYNDNFNYGSLAGPAGPAVVMPTVLNPRPLLVTRNPVSNAVPVWDPANFTVANPAMPPYANLGHWQQNVAYYPGDIAEYGWIYYYCAAAVSGTTTPNADAAHWTAIPQYNGGSYSQNAVVYVLSYGPYPPNQTPASTVSIPYGVQYYRSLINNNTTNPTTAGQTVWAPITGVPEKAAINSASFPELFRAFWGTMSAGADANDFFATPFGYEVSLSSVSTYSGAGVSNGTYTGNSYGISSNLTSTPDTTIHKQRMFRSSLRDPRTAASVGLVLPPPQELQLRAALAAINTIDLRRSSTSNIDSYEVPLTAMLDGAPIPVNVIVNGIRPQPFMTEVYCNTDLTNVPVGVATPNSKAYVAIKLCNPYSTPIDVSNWVLSALSRTGSATISTTSGLTMTPLAQIPAGTVIPARTGLVNGYLVIDNYDNSTVLYRPGETGLPSTGLPPSTPITVTNGLYVNIAPNASGVGLDGAIGNELVLLRYHNGTAATTGQIPGPGGSSYTYNEATSNPNYLWDMVPVDSFDFTGTSTQATPQTSAMAWHYARGDGAGQFLYPGQYDGLYGASPGNPRQQGTQFETWNPSSAKDPWDSNLGGAPPMTGGAMPVDYIALTGASTVATFGPNNYTINLLSSPSTTGATSFPYGGFARSGDILMAPYFGSYRVTYTNSATSTTYLFEMNSPSIDSAFANATGVTDLAPYNLTLSNSIAPSETIGRCCTDNPLDYLTYTSSTNAGTIGAGGTTLTDPNLPLPSGSIYVNTNTVSSATWANIPGGAAGSGWDVVITSGAGTGQIRNVTAYSGTTLTLDSALTGGVTGTCSYVLRRPYWWTGRVLDYLTVFSARDDYLPNVDPATPNLTVATNPPLTPPAQLIQPVTNDNAAVSPNNSSLEDTVGTDGKININTAPWRVLAALPLVMQAGVSPPAPDAYNSYLVAQQIVADRQKFGPFRSLFDLNRVYDMLTPGSNKGFGNGNGTISGTGTTNVSQGNIAYPAGSGFTNQFDELNLQTTRLSNLITTRSDTFTVYIVVEGWQNAGTSSASLVTTRRAAFIVDRNGITPTSRNLKIIPVPNN